LLLLFVNSTEFECPDIQKKVARAPPQPSTTMSAAAATPRRPAPAAVDPSARRRSVMPESPAGVASPAASAHGRTPGPRSTGEGKHHHYQHLVPREELETLIKEARAVAARVRLHCRAAVNPFNPSAVLCH
jgi:hypothetical protein